jgi:hypothetical protein
MSLLKKIKEMADMVVSPAAAADEIPGEMTEMESPKHEKAEEQMPHAGMSPEMDEKALEGETDLAPSKQESEIDRKDKMYKKQIEEMKKSFDPFKKESDSYTIKRKY